MAGVIEQLTAANGTDDPGTLMLRGARAGYLDALAPPAGFCRRMERGDRTAERNRRCRSRGYEARDWLTAVRRELGEPDQARTP